MADTPDLRNSAAESLAEAVCDKSNAMDKIQELSKDLTELIRRHPLPSLTVGVGVGFLLGQILHRRKA